MKRILIIILVTISTFSCNKDQNASKLLDGTWEVTRLFITKNNISEIIEHNHITMTFDNCVLKDSTYCSMSRSQLFNNTNFTYSGLYKISDKGTTLTVTDQFTESFDEYYFIYELSIDRLILIQTDGDMDITYEFEKI